MARVDSCRRKSDKTGQQYHVMRWCTATTMRTHKGELQSVNLLSSRDRLSIRGTRTPIGNVHYPVGVLRLARADRFALPTPKSISYVRYLADFAVQDMANVWLDTQTGAFTDDKTYVVQTNAKVVERCILMATDPGDLVLDPTCGSGTTAYVAEQWGRRWITIDTSPRGAGACPGSGHGRALPVLLACRQPGGPAEGSRDRPHRAVGSADAGGHPARLRLRARSAHCPQVHRQQRRDRRHLGALAGDAGAVAGGSEREARLRLGGLADSPRGVRGLVSGGGGVASTVVGGTHRPAAGDRRLHRGQGRPRVPLRQALRGQPEGAGGGGRSRSRAFRRIGCWPSTRTRSCWIAWRKGRPTTARSTISRA